MGAIEKLRASFRRQQVAARDEKASADTGSKKDKKDAGDRMMTVTTAEISKHAGEKEKAEKRRALGRGLDSLLPGPRVVSLGSAPGGAGLATRAMAPAPHVPGEGQPILHPVQMDSSVGGAAVAVMPALADVAVLPATPGADVSTDLPPELRSPSSDHGVAATLPLPGQPDNGIAVAPTAETRVPLVVNLPITDIDKNPFQTRYVEKDEALEELTNSIKANGVLQPIVVRPAKEDGRYILILGERRLHASKMAGKERIPAIVRRVSEQQAAEMTIIENLQREDLSPLEQAEAFRVLSEQFKLTQAQIGERVGLSRESVANYMRLLRLPDPTKQLLSAGEISFATAKELLKIEDKERIAKTSREIVEKGMTFDQVEKLVWRITGVFDPAPGVPQKKKSARSVDPNVRAAQMELERLLGMRVRIRDRKGKGRIVIEYSTVDDYERVLAMLSGRKN
jgi:ParB family chromosome partitioning protein